MTAPSLGLSNSEIFHLFLNLQGCFVHCKHVYVSSLSHHLTVSLYTNISNDAPICSFKVFQVHDLIMISSDIRHSFHIIMTFHYEDLGIHGPSGLIKLEKEMQNLTTDIYTQPAFEITS